MTIWQFSYYLKLPQISKLSQIKFLNCQNVSNGQKLPQFSKLSPFALGCKIMKNFLIATNCKEIVTNCLKLLNCLNLP